MEVQGRLWSDFSFVASSGYRERVISSLVDKPKLPKQLAKETSLRIFHVSRALGELKERGLVECLTPLTKGRGRLYGLTAKGSTLLEYLKDSSRRYVPLDQPSKDIGFKPKVRASTLLRSMECLKGIQGEGAVEQALRGWPVDPNELTEDTWLSVDACARFLDLVEAKFGDGSHGFIRRLFSEAVATFPTIREQILKPIPLEALAERATIVYGKEWNFGRLEVKTGRRQASFLHFDWMPTAGMCALFHGVYEGILRARGYEGKVTKTHCVREGDDHCEYRVEW